MLHESAAQTQPARVRLKSLTGTTSAEVESYVNEGWHISHQEYVAMPTERGGKHAIHWCVTLRKECPPKPRWYIEEEALGRAYIDTSPTTYPNPDTDTDDDNDGGNPAPVPTSDPTTPPAEDIPIPAPAQVKYPWDLGTRVKLDGRCDDGAHHRGISIARDLIKAGMWDAQGEIRFTDVYKIHTALEFRGVTLRDLSVSYDERGDCFVRLATTDPVDPTNAIVPVNNDPRPTPVAPTPPPPKQQLPDRKRQRNGSLIEYYDEEMDMWHLDMDAMEVDSLNQSFLRDNPIHIPGLDTLEVTHA